MYTRISDQFTPSSFTGGGVLLFWFDISTKKGYGVMYLAWISVYIERLLSNLLSDT